MIVLCDDFREWCITTISMLGKLSLDQPFVEDDDTGKEDIHTFLHMMILDTCPNFALSKHIQFDPRHETRRSYSDTIIGEFPLLDTGEYSLHTHTNSIIVDSSTVCD